MNALLVAAHEQQTKIQHVQLPITVVAAGATGTTLHDSKGYTTMHTWLSISQVGQTLHHSSGSML